MKKESLPEPNQISKSTTNDATGIDFSTDITGERSSSTRERQQLTAPNTAPAKKARKNPPYRAIAVIFLTVTGHDREVMGFVSACVVVAEECVKVGIERVVIAYLQ